MAEPGDKPDSEKPEAAAGGDPSMEDILASIRRILNEEAPEGGAGELPAHEAVPDEADEAPLVLDRSMLTAAPTAPPPVPEGSSAMSDAPLPAAVSPAEDSFDEPPVAEPSAAEPVPAAPASSRLLAQETEVAAGGAMATLAARLLSSRDSATHRGGPTIEELVREEVRPLLKAWLDQYLPPMVERLVRAEIERLGNRLGD